MPKRGIVNRVCNSEGREGKYSAEEKRLLEEEGVRLSSHNPLTKDGEREEQEKKEYVDGLEERLKRCTEENLDLEKRAEVLQTENQKLAAQKKKLQALALLRVLSMAFDRAPNLQLRQNSSSNYDGQKDQ